MGMKYYERNKIHRFSIYFEPDIVHHIQCIYLVINSITISGA